MEFKLNNASWVDQPYGNLVLNQVQPMAITMDYNHCGDDVVLPLVPNHKIKFRFKISNLHIS